MHLDSHGTEYVFDSVSGFTSGACAFLAYRRESEALVDSRRMESWVIEPTDGLTPQGERRVSIELGVEGFLSGLWSSPRGIVYVTDFHGRLHVHYHDDDSAMRKWTRIDFGDDVELHGVWGTDDRDVYVLGRDAFRCRMWVYRGGRFEPMPGPPGRATMVRGLGPELLYAAGDHGFLAQWNGHRWLEISLPLLRNVTGLSVSDPDEIWLTTDNGKLFEGTSHGWALRAQFDAPLFDVAVWRGDVWVAAGPHGLLRLVPRSDRLVIASSDIAPVALDARGDLLALAHDYLAASNDGQRFQISCRHVLSGTRSTHEPRWRSRART